MQIGDVSGAEIRLRYSCRADEAEAAARAAESVRERWLAAGALDVKLDPVTEPVTRARAPDVAAAPTLREKVDATWRAMGDSGPEESRRPRLLDLAMTVAAEGAVS